MSRYSYSITTKRYREKETGRFLSSKEVSGIRDQYISAQETWAEGLAARMVSGRDTPAKFVMEMRDRVKISYVTEFLIGRGGKNAVTSNGEYGKVGAMLKQQYGYLDRWQRQLESGVVSIEDFRSVSDRAMLYFESSRQAFEHGRARQWNLDLPAMPGDGSTECGPGCKCTWDFEDVQDGTALAYWTLGNSVKPCGTCEERSNAWAPYRKGE